MDKLPEGYTVDPSFNVINNVKPVTDETEIKLQEFEQPFTVTLKLGASELIRLDRIANDSGQSRNELIQALCTKEVTSNIGKAVITGPSSAKNKKVTGPKIVGPSWSQP